MNTGIMMNTNARCSAIAGRPIAVSALWHSSQFSSGSNISRPRTHMVIRAGLLDFITPVAGKTLKKSARTAELVEELLDLTRGTQAGLKASYSLREQIEETVDKLSEKCMRSPLRSNLIFGEWEVVYASKPTTAGGPFRSPIGRAIFLGQRATQVIAEPNICINEVSYKALGLVPGSATQEGEIEPINGTTFQITFPGQVGKKEGAVGGPPTRLIELAYLDERIRVARALPQKDGDEGSFYVFVRTDGEEDAEEEIYGDEVVVAAPTRQQRSRARAASVAVDNDSEDNGEDARSRGALPLPSFNFSSLKKPAGTATQAERSVAARGGQINQSRGSGRSKTQRGTQSRGGDREATAPSATPQRRSREELAAERAAVKAAADEKRREAAAAAAAARAQAQEDRRRAREEAAEERRRAQAAARAEREAAQQRKRAVRESYQELAAAATEAESNAKDAATAYKSAERKASSNVKAAAQARNIISETVAAAEKAASELKEGQDEEIYLKKEVSSDQRLVNKLEKKLKKVSAAIAPRI